MVLNWWGSPLKRARRAARSGRWADAASAYQRHLTRDPWNARVRVQLGHALKEQGDLHAAAAAYRAAVRIAPAAEDGWIHLAHLERRLGDRAAALAALEQAIAHGGSALAVDALVQMGARERLPLAVQARIEAEEGIYAMSRYAAWRAARPVSAAPPAPDVLAVIDARRASPEWITATRAALDGVACLILTDDAPLPGDAPWMGAGDAIAVATAHPACAVGKREGHATGDPPVCFLLVEAGTRIAPDAVAWLRTALAETGAGAAYCDHDHWEHGHGAADGQDIIHRDPCFQPMFDPLWFARAEVRPPCLLVTATAAAPLPGWGALFAARMALPVAYAHVPLLLASRPADVMSSPGAPPASLSDAVPPPATPLSPRQAEEGVIQVIVQTRDAPDMLEACIGSLRATAARPDLLDIVIMDNRSVLPRTAALLADWAGRGIVRVIPHDEPFNWARANNLAVGGRVGGPTDAPHLLFLNNDVEMESAGWDVILRADLAIERVGALGALLLYPDRLIQHAGVVFGMGEGGPVHEGIGHSPEPGGPAARWRHPRAAAAVTGAWLATTRALFDAVGGFEERLPIAYNDVDFCLRVRAAGRQVAQTSHIVALHRESATRGIVMSPAEQIRDQADWAWMRARWGSTLDLDPAYNPHWLRVGQPFDGLRTPPPQAVSCWIAASAGSHPWSVAPLSA